MSGAILSSDMITRQVLFAVELLDPVTGELVSQPATVSCDGLGNAPLNNLSGRFVFIGGGTPGTVRVDLHGLPYEPISSPPPGAGQTLLRLTLQPTALYPFAASATLVSGRLVDGAARVAGASIGVTFADLTANDQALPALTNQLGDFAVLLRLDPTAVTTSDPVTADITLTFTRGATTKTRPGLVARAGEKTAFDAATNAPVTLFDWAAL
jgi:hypothetical protein